MSKIDEIKKSKELFDKGEITETEFESRKKEIMSMSEIESKTNEKKLDTYSEINSINVSAAGKLIKRAVNAQVTSYICTTLGFILYIFSLVTIMDGIMKGRSIDRILGDSPSFFFASIFFIAGFIFWVSSLTRMYRAGVLLESSSSFQNNFTPEIKEVKLHSAPEIVSQTKTEESTFMKGKWEEINIEFADGVKGIIYKPTKGEYSYKDSRGFNAEYDNYNNCVDGLHYYQTTGKKLESGYLGTFS